MNLNKFTVQESFAINAGAGSGKTYTLSRRYINALLGFDYFREDYNTQKSYFEKLQSARVNQIVTITYTEAAALEMKGRIFELVSKVVDFDNLDLKDADYSSIKEANENISEDEYAYVIKTLKQAYKDSSNAKISTIHSYCLDLIKVNSDIARIDTSLNIIKDDEKSKELSSIIFEILNDDRNKEKVLDISKNISIWFLNGLINKYVSDSKFRKNYNSFDKNSIERDDYKKVMFELYPLPDIKEDFYAVKDFLLSENVEDVQKYIDFINDYITKVFNFEAKSWGVLSKEHDVTISFNRRPWTRLKDIKHNIERIKSLDSFVEVYSYIDEEKEELFFNQIEEVKDLLLQIKSKYDKKLIELEKIDFDTIITKTLELIPYANTDFKYIMVDEFQDTNETQFEIVKSSMSKDTNLFVVGDSKQSIYSFQGAEIEVFNSAVEDKTLFSSIEDMSKNHRSDGIVLDTVNDIFKMQLRKNPFLNLISPNFEASFQSLEVFKSSRADKGSFKYLVSTDEGEEPIYEVENIANLISNIANGKLEEYQHITKLIKEKKKAIAIIYDSSSKMLELKEALKDRGITAKVSATDNFYYTKEVNDIFNVLKAIDILLKEKKEFTANDKYYIAAALRSNIIRCDDNSIKKHLDNNSIHDSLARYVEYFKNNTLSKTVKFIYDDSNLFGVYTHFEDIEQRVANLYKFLTLCQEYESSDETNLYRFLTLIENSIYFSEAGDEEAFYKSENSKSIEICTIHATKGLAYPLVLLGNSTKGLYGQIQSDSLKHNNFTLNGQKKEIVGFTINDYTPLSHRVLKEIDKLKHLAEKKRLLYVALTRAEHNVIISSHLKQKKDGSITLREDSFLNMIIESLDIDIDELFGQNEKYCIKVDNDVIKPIENEIEYIEHSLKPLEFTSKEKISATKKKETMVSKDDTAARLGTATHEIIEYYWDSFNQNSELILDKKTIFDNDERILVKKSMDKFYQSEVYELLKDNVEHRFELEFNVDNKTGFIDFIYFDKENDGCVIVDFKTGTPTKDKEEKYQKQLDFYIEIMTSLGYRILDAKLLWL